MKITDFSRQLTRFLGEYLPGQHNVSANTIKSYRDAFTLLLRFCRDKKRIAPERLQIARLDTVLVTEFLSHLETDRHNSIPTRNQRLAALHAFFRYLQIEEPDLLLHCQRILAIPCKRCGRPEMGFLCAEDLAMILAQPDLFKTAGRRDAVLLSILYDTGARVQELIDLSLSDLRLESPAQVRLTGKGKKMRSVPLMARTVKLLRQYFQDHGLDLAHHGREPVFRNREGQRLSRSGVRYILQKYVKRAKTTRKVLRDDVSPHMLRHSKAMHLLEAGNPLVVIRDILGHTDVKTTEIYAHANMEMKRRALASVADASPTPDMPSWQKNQGLLEWLRDL